MPRVSPENVLTCLACGAKAYTKIAPQLCPQCGATESYSLPLETTGRRRPRVVHASKVDTTAIRRRATGEIDLDTLTGGGFAVPSWVGLWGLAGSGKTRLALRWLTSLGRVLWCSLEMPAQLVVATAESAGAKVENLWIVEDVIPSELVQLAREERCNLIGFDSISELNDEQGLELLAVMRKWTAGGSRFGIVICHETKDGNYRGPSTFGHAPDYLLKTEPHPDGCQVTIKKSRFCAQGSVVCPLVKHA